VEGPASHSQTKLESAVNTLGKTARAVALDTGDARASSRYKAGYISASSAKKRSTVDEAHAPHRPARRLRGRDDDMVPRRAKIAMESKFWGGVS
jgi:hypothetical protein